MLDAFARRQNDVKRKRGDHEQTGDKNIIRTDVADVRRSLVKRCGQDHVLQRRNGEHRVVLVRRRRVARYFLEPAVTAYQEETQQLDEDHQPDLAQQAGYGRQRNQRRGRWFRR